MRVHQLVLPALLAWSVACGGGGGGEQTDSSTPGDAAEPALQPPPPAGGQQLATNTFHLMPGQEIYMCYQFNSPSVDKAITYVQSISVAGVHHLALFQAFGRNEDPAPHECPSLIKETWQPVFVSGTGAKELTLPSGAGFQIAAGTQYILQLHLQNTTDSEIDVRAGINLAYTDPTSVTPAGIYGIGNQDISIPPGATDYTVSEHCSLTKDLNVFAVFPHMHKLGTEFLVTQGSAGSAFYSVDPWTFGNQPIDPLTATLHQNDTLDVSCHWSNPSADTISFGESSDNEMCYFVLFYTPFDGLDGCID